MATTDPTSSSVFNAVHSLEVSDQPHPNILKDNNRSIARATIACNPLLLGSLSHDQSKGNPSNVNHRNHSSVSDSLNEKTSNTSIHIDQIFKDVDDQVSEQIDVRFDVKKKKKKNLSPYFLCFFY